MKIRIAAVALVLGFIAPVFAAPRLMLRSHTTLSDPKDPENSVLLREIPRQALIVAATEDFGVASVDLTLEPQATTQPGDVELDFTRKLDPANKSLTITLLDANGNALAKDKLAPGFSSASIVSLADVGRLSESLINDHWRDLVGKQLGAAPIPPRWSTATTQPANVERLLSTIDFSHAFLAARVAHTAVAADGESVGRLSALSRAYINLGESLRHVMGGQADAGLARGLAYANRLVRLADKDPLAYWTRAYAEALIGLPADSDADLKHAAELAGKVVAPDWVAPLAAFNHCRTNEINANIDPPLEAYLAWRTVEPCKLPSAVINFSNIALAKNPGAIRIIDSMINVSGVSMHHVTSDLAPHTLNRLVATLANEKTVPANVRDLVSAAVIARFNPPAIVALLESLEQIPADDAQPLTFATYASIVRDCQFVDACRQLTFMREEWAVDPSTTADAWLTLLGKHRWAALLKTFNHLQSAVSPARVEAVNKLEFHDVAITFGPIANHMAGMNLLNDPRTNESWGLTQFRMADSTTWDYSIMCSRFRGPNGGPSRGVARLESIAPDQPMILAAKLDWREPSVMSKLDEIEKQAGGNPVIGSSLGYAYSVTNRADDAIRVLKQVISTAPDNDTYWRLSLAYANKQDPKGWRETWDDYLVRGEDYALSKPLAAKNLAWALLARNQPTEALKYAEQAGDSYSAWGLLTYANTLARCGEYDKAWQTLTAEADRYGDTLYLPLFFAVTGHGDEKAAQTAADQFLNRPQPTMNCAILQQVLGKTDSFYHDAQAVYEAEPTQYSALVAALAKLEQKDGAAARKIIDSVKPSDLALPVDFTYDQCFDGLRACIADPKKVCAHGGAMVQPPETTITSGSSFAVANCCYVFGRLYELNGNLKEAKFWYHESINQPGDLDGLAPLAAIALKRLGDPTYK